MNAFRPIDPARAEGKAKALLEAVHAKLGRVPNMAAMMASSPALLGGHGHVADAELARVREAGFADGEFGEIIANVALNVFTNYFNSVTKPHVDFPAVKPRGLAKAA